MAAILDFTCVTYRFGPKNSITPLQRWCKPKNNHFCVRYGYIYADGTRKLQKPDWVVPKLANWRRAYWETTSGIVQNLTNLSYRAVANLKISIFLLNMFVCMLIELENHKILQAGCFWSWQIKEEGKLSSIDISGQLLWHRHWLDQADWDNVISLT